MFEYAFACRYVETNPFKGRCSLTDAEGQTSQTQRTPGIERKGWGDNIYALFKSPIYQRDFWKIVGEPLVLGTPLIAVYAGLRLEEICNFVSMTSFVKRDSPTSLSRTEIGSQNLQIRERNPQDSRFTKP